MSITSENRSLRPGRWLLVACTVTLAVFLQGCAALMVYHPPPANLEDRVEIPRMPGVRAWGDVYSESLEKSAIESIRQEKAANHGKLEPVVYGLALSGGGGDGAFGAGLLCGWTEAGTRPRFKLVTGVSTGALIAPFAFLGKAYDARLKEAYTTISDRDIYKAHKPLAIILSLANVRPLPSMASTRPLAELLKKLIDDQMIQEIAREHLKGRRLLVGTTQMDAQRLVIWNMGAIAASGDPRAPELFRKILLASASIPAAFPPQYITVEAGGQKFEEMHSDGGVMAEVMLYENALKPFSMEQHLLNIAPRSRKLYLIRNQQALPEWQYVKPQLKYIASRGIDSLLKSQGLGDLYRLYVYAQRDEFDYNLAFIPADFQAEHTSEFDTAYMNKLFDLAYNLARSGYKWHKYPPGFSPSTKATRESQRPDKGAPAKD
jgi:predicted acylesterase/phospholipase RssA